MNEETVNILRAKPDMSTVEEKIAKKKLEYYFKGPYYNEVGALWLMPILTKIRDTKAHAIFSAKEMGYSPVTLQAKIIQGWNFLIEQIAEEPWKTLRKECIVKKRDDAVIIKYKESLRKPVFKESIDEDNTMELFSSWKDELETFINAADTGDMFVKKDFFVENIEPLEDLLKGVLPEDLYMLVVTNNVVKAMKK